MEKNSKKSSFKIDVHPLLEVCRLLNEFNVKYVVIGGWAVNIHGYIRPTKDVDIMVERTKENVTKTLKALENLPWRIAGEIMPEEIISKPFTIIGDYPRVDIITSSMGINYETIKDKILWTEVDNIKIPYADIDTLIKLKQTGRKRDEADIEELELIKKLKEEQKND